MDEYAFRAAIAAAPDDDAPRLVYADWLDEHGEPDRAELCRLGCEMRRLEAWQRAWCTVLPRWHELRWRRRELADRVSACTPDALALPETPEDQ